VGCIPRDKARLGHDADHAPPSIAEVKKKEELYLFSPKAPPWHVTGPLDLLFYLITI
jgi:hypothetical protein